jgi:hypothetical protein
VPATRRVAGPLRCAPACRPDARASPTSWERRGPGRAWEPFFPSTTEGGGGCPSVSEGGRGRLGGLPLKMRPAPCAALRRAGRMLAPPPLRGRGEDRRGLGACHLKMRPAAGLVSEGLPGLAKLPRHSRNLIGVSGGRRRARGLPLDCHRDGKPERRLGPKGSARCPQGHRGRPTGHAPQGVALASQGAVGIGFRAGTGRKDPRPTASARR